MKKWKHTLLVSTLVLGSVPYNAVISPNQASAAEVEDQTAEKSLESQNDSTMESGDSAEIIDQTQTELNQNQEIIEVDNLELDNEPVQTETEQASDSEMNSNVKERLITPRNTVDFALVVDGVAHAVQNDYKLTNATIVSFERADPNNAFARAYRYEIRYNNELVIPRTDGNQVDFSTLTSEGIYKVAIEGLDEDGYGDTGFFYNNVQRTTSSVNIDGVLNDENDVVIDPDSINVGRDEMDTYGEYTYSWVISGTDLAGKTVEIKGDNRQPSKDELDALPPGNYIITNTVNEKVPEGYESKVITDTTSGAFKLTGGSLVVEHIFLDKGGKEISRTTEDTKYGRLNADYETNPINIKGYKLIEEEKPVNQNGKYTNSEQIVKYYYEKIKTNVIVEYVDEQGNPITNGENIPGEYGENYTAEPKDIHGYEIVENPENSTGTFTDQDQTVTYVYKKKATQVNVHHVDKDGNPLSEDTSIPGVFDDDYTTTPKDIPGYIVKVVPNNATGKHTVDPTEVTYVYEKIKTNIHVEYVDEQGNPIGPDLTISGEYGDNYTTEQKDILGYDLVVEPTNPNGTFTDQDQTVKYVYKKKETEVNIHFVDEQGKPLTDDIVKDGLFDDPYSTEPASIPGYILVEVPSNASGKHTADPTEVTYVYKKIEAPTVNDTLEGSKTVSGKGMPDSQVIVTFPNGSTITVDVDKNGNWQADVPEDVVLKKGDNVTAVTLDPKTGSTSDSGKGKVLPLVTKLPDTGTVGNTEKLVDPANTKTTAKITSSDPVTRSASTTKSASGKQLPNTGEEAGAYAVNLGLFALILAFFGKMLKKRETE